MVQGKISAYDAVIRKLQQVEQEGKEVLDHVALVRRAVDNGYQETLRSLIRVLVERVDVRVDGIIISIHALPTARVYELGEKVAPTAIIYQPLVVRRLKR